MPESRVSGVAFTKTQKQYFHTQIMETYALNLWPINYLATTFVYVRGRKGKENKL